MSGTLPRAVTARGHHRTDTPLHFESRLKICLYIMHEHELGKHPERLFEVPMITVAELKSEARGLWESDVLVTS